MASYSRSSSVFMYSVVLMYEQLVFMLALEWDGSDFSTGAVIIMPIIHLLTDQSVKLWTNYSFLILTFPDMTVSSTWRWFNTKTNMVSQFPASISPCLTSYSATLRYHWKHITQSWPLTWLIQLMQLKNIICQTTCVT